MSTDAPGDLRVAVGPQSKAQLLHVLQEAGQAPLVLEGRCGEAIVVLPHGGRILALYARGSDQNFLWTNPLLASAESAREHFLSSRWCNSGGDRTWLAPEIDFFYPRYPDTQQLYFQPRELDPGQYHATLLPSNIRLTNELSVRSYRHGWTARVRIAKSVRPIDNPLAVGGRDDSTRSLQFAGYQLTTTLELMDPDVGDVSLAAWNLLQLPGGGEMIVPTWGECAPITYFGDIPEADLLVTDRCLRYRMTAPGEQKIGVDAVDVVGRVGYLSDAATESPALVIRNFFVNPSGPYLDVPLHSPELSGQVFQACNINADYLGRFAELEYHALPVSARLGVFQRRDVSQVWAFRGSRSAIDAAAQRLLGAGGSPTGASQARVDR